MVSHFVKQRINEWRSGLYRYKEICLLPIRLLLTLNTYMLINRIFRLPNVRCAQNYHPRIALKYLGNYLGLSLDYKCRGIALANHYKFLNDHVGQDFIANIMHDQIILWEETKKENYFYISLTYPYYELEGDLSLIFYMNSNETFTLSFSIIPGYLIDVTDGQVLLITRSQGRIGSFDFIKSATKILHETTPVALLIIAIMAIVSSLKISTIAGVCSKEQVIVGGVAYANKTFSTYEKLWIAVGGEKINEKAYRIPTVFQQKPLSEIRQKYRSRTKRKREFKKAVYNHVIRNFNEKCLSTT